MPPGHDASPSAHTSVPGSARVGSPAKIMSRKTVPHTNTSTLRVGVGPPPASGSKLWCGTPP